MDELVAYPQYIILFLWFVTCLIKAISENKIYKKISDVFL